MGTLHIGKTMIDRRSPWLRGMIGRVPALSPALATTSFNFMGGTMPAGATLTRASTGWTFNSSGVLTSYANDAPRFRYNPTTLALEGLLVEPAATNLLPNAAGGGAGTGTPGTAPTGWAVTSTGNGVTRTITAGTTEDGINANNFRFAGTPSVGLTLGIGFSATTATAAAPGDVIRSAAFVTLQPGGTGLTNLDLIQLAGAQRDSGGVSLGTLGGPNIVPPTGALRNARFDAAITMAHASTAFFSSQLRIPLVSGQPIDFTFKVGVPQYVRNAPLVETSPIVSTTVAVTRAADVLTLPVANGTYAAVVSRLSGATVVPGVVVSAGTYVVPTDPSPVQSVAFVPAPIV